MFSAKNYGLPKDLIEAAKKVHEKQLEEGVGKYAEPRIDPKIRDEKNTAPVSRALHDLAGREREKNIEKLPGAKKSQTEKLPGAKKSQTEEVQFTEEELAEAFAIFLEENFHVDMLTEEDLDYVFEEEFPQWLEENRLRAAANIGRKAFNYVRNLFSTGTRRAADVGRNVRNAASQNPVSTAVTGVGAGALGATAVNRDTGSDKNRNNELPKDADESDVPYADSDEEQKKTPEKAIRKSIAKAKEEVKKEEAKKQASQAKPTSTARKQVKRSAPKPQSFGALLRKVGGNAPATTATAAGRRKVALLDARARARTAARDAIVRKTGRGQLSWAKKAFNSDN
jgi:hypothetical protein